MLVRVRPVVISLVMEVGSMVPDPVPTLQPDTTGFEKEPERKEEADLEKEVDRIQKTAEKQLASVHGLNVSLVKKIRKSEAHSSALLSVNKELEDKNNDLVDKLQRALHENYTLSVKTTKLEESEKDYKEKASAVVAAELATKKVEARLDSVLSERDVLASKLAGRDVTINELQLQLNEAKEAFDKERESRETAVAERSLQISTLSQEKEKEQQSREELENQLKALEVTLATATADLNAAVMERDKITKEADDLKTESERNLALVREEAAITIDQHNDLLKERDDALSEKVILEQTVEQLMQEKINLAADVVSRDGELQRSTEEVKEMERKTATLQSDLNNKTSETTSLAGKVAELGAERDELAKKCEELEILMTELEKEADRAKADLKTRSETLDEIEGERNLLHEEKDVLSRNFTDVRDKFVSLEQEKSELEGRVLQLEQLEKELSLAVHDLKLEKEGLANAYEKELHEKIAEKEREFEEQIVALREELDMVVDRHAESHRIEKGREEAAAAAVAEKDLVPFPEPGGGETSRDVEVLELVSDEPTPGMTVEKSVPDIAPEETVIEVERPDEIEYQEAGATDDDTNWRSLEVPTEIPAAPLPYEAPRVDYEEDAEDVSGTAVMTRTIEENEDEDEDEDEEVDEVVTDDEDSVEGETTPRNMVISEEVVEEVVVDKPEESDAMTPREMPAPLASEEVDVAPMGMGEANMPSEAVISDVGTATKEPEVNTAKVEVTPVIDGNVVTGPIEEGTRDAGVMEPPPRAKPKAPWLCCFSAEGNTGHKK